MNSNLIAPSVPAKAVEGMSSGGGEGAIGPRCAKERARGTRPASHKHFSVRLRARRLLDSRTGWTDIQMVGDGRGFQIEGRRGELSLGTPMRKQPRPGGRSVDGKTPAGHPLLLTGLGEARFGLGGWVKGRGSMLYMATSDGSLFYQDRTLSTTC